MQYKKDVEAVYDNSFCMDSDCIHYFEDMCMLCMSDEGGLIFPDSTVWLPSRQSEECKMFTRGSSIFYELSDEHLNELPR